LSREPQIRGGLIRVICGLFPLSFYSGEQSELTLQLGGHCIATFDDSREVMLD
jgi:hypothetical protein